MSVVLFASIIFVLIITLLILLLTWVRSKLASNEKVTIALLPDGSRNIVVTPGDFLLNTLIDNGVFLPSSCGGKGTCGTCKCRILEGLSEPLPTERSLLSPTLLRRGNRLACQVKVKNNLQLALPDGILDVKHYPCRVISNHNLTATMKELVLELPENSEFSFKAGGYVQITCDNPQTIHYENIPIDAPFEAEWQNSNWRKLNALLDEPITRAYSMANYPCENRRILLNIRLALPPNPALPTGKMSSYLFNLRENDIIDVSGPFGEFYAKETENEMCFIGGGAGMAPMRAHIFDQLRRLNTHRKITFWYGARNLAQAFYIKEFDELEKEFPNFSWHIALSNPDPTDPVDRPKGFIHEVLYQEYIKNHPNPEDIEYYLCGPPRMLEACKKMLDENGVEKNNIFYDDFGS